MAYIDWWNRTGPVTLGERFGLNEISIARNTLSPIKSHTAESVMPSQFDEISLEEMEDIKKQVKFGQQVKDGGRIDMKPGGIVEPGVEYYSTDRRGKAPKPKGPDSPFYKALDAKGQKIALHVYGTLDISNRQKNRINRGEITMDTKPFKMNPETDISVKSKHSSNIIEGVDFKNMKLPDGTDMEKAFIEDLKLRAKQPQKAVIDYGNEWFADKYPISERQVKRAIPYLINKHKIKYLELEETPATRNIKKRKSYLDVSSSRLEEGRMREAKTKILKEKDLARKIDFGHRVSKRHMAALGLQFDTNLVGMDSRVINQVIIRPTEKKLDKLYSKQFKIFEQLKDNPTDELLKKQLADINKQVKALVKTTSGRLVGVTIDPNTLESSFEGLKKKYSLTQFMNENMTIKDLEKLSPAEQEKFLTKQLTKAVDAEIKKGFVPNDFKKILSDKKSQEALLKYAQKRAPELIGKLKWAFKNPASKVSMKLLSSPFALLGAGYLTYKSGLLGTEVKADTLKEPSDKTQEAGITAGDVSKGALATGAGYAITHPKQAWELAKKTLLKPLDKIIAPFLTPAISIAAHGKPDVTSGLEWITPAFWNAMTKRFGLTGTIEAFKKAPNAAAKSKIAIEMLLRAGIPMKLLPIISGAAATVSGPLLVSDAAKALQKRIDKQGLTGIIEEQSGIIGDEAGASLLMEDVGKEKKRRDAEGMDYATGGIASLMK